MIVGSGKQFALLGFVMCCIGVVLAAPAALAQQPPTGLPVEAVPLPPWEPGSPAQVIEISLNKARAIRLADPVREVIVAQEEVANVFVPEDVNVSGLVYIIAREVGSTNMFFVGEKGNIVLQADVRVSLDVESVQAALDSLLPNENIDVTTHRDGIFLTGSVRNAAVSANAVAIAQRFLPDEVEVTNMLQLLGSQQVVLRVRVAEIERTTIKNFGIDATYGRYESPNRGFSISGQGATNLSTTITHIASGTIATGLPGFDPATFNVLERQGLAKTLAEPTLTAISGETASFLAGGEFPFPSGTDLNGNTIFEFREFGIRLNFTPVVLDKGRINLHISTEISAISQTGAIQIGATTINSLTSKRTETTVDLPSGGSVMIAGLLKNDETDRIDGVPFLKDIPVLGAFFRKTEFDRNETELVITVTAYLAKPVSNEQRLTLPTDGFAPASEIDMYLLGRLHSEYTKSELPPLAVPLKGPFGYIME